MTSSDSINQTTHRELSTNRSWDSYLEAILGPKNRDDWLSVTLASIYILIFVTGLVGNICTCYVIVRNRRMRTVTNCYLFSLAVADILTLLLGLPPEFYSIFEAYPWRFGEGYCLLKTFMTETTSSASILTITCFTIERYMAICHSLKMQTMSGVKRAVKNITAIWILAMISAIPYPLHTRVFPYIRDDAGRPIENAFVCNIPENWRNRMANVFQVSTFLLFVLPMLVITILYLRIGVALRKTECGMHRPARQTRPSLGFFGNLACRSKLFCRCCRWGKNDRRDEVVTKSLNAKESNNWKSSEMDRTKHECLRHCCCCCCCFRASSRCSKQSMNPVMKDLKPSDDCFPDRQVSDTRPDNISRTFLNTDNSFSRRCSICREVFQLALVSPISLSRHRRSPRFLSQTVRSETRLPSSLQTAQTTVRMELIGEDASYAHERSPLKDDICLSCRRSLATLTVGTPLENVNTNLTSDEPCNRRVQRKVIKIKADVQNEVDLLTSHVYLVGDKHTDREKRKASIFCTGGRQTQPNESTSLQGVFYSQLSNEAESKERVKILENLKIHPETRVEPSTSRSSQGEGVIRNKFKVKIQARPRRSVLKMLVAVVVAFFICWAPFHIQRLLTVYDQGVVDTVWIDLQNALFFVSGILYFVNCTINPILYTLMSLNFKQAFSTTLTCHGKATEENVRRMECEDYSKSFNRSRISIPLAPLTSVSPTCPVPLLGPSR